MTFEPDDEATVLRQLREEIAKIREEQFVASLPTNNIGIASPVNSSSGVPLPTTGVDSTLPLVIFTTKDTGVIDLLNFDGKNPNKDFTIGETITGQSSGATAEVGDIDTLTSTTGVLTLVPSSITGTFSNNENLNGSGAGGNNIANADGSQFTQTGRGHLNAGAGSIIASSENVSAPFEIHFIDNAEQDGQIIYLRALEGQTIRMRRSVSFDGTTGNLDLDESFDIVENAIVFFQYQIASNISVTGGWVPLITSVSATAGAGGFQFPILYPKEDLGTQNGVIDLSLTQSNGHYKQITLDGDASLTFSNLPPATNGFKFYVLTIQDSTGGHVYTDLPDSVLFESTLLGQLQTGANAQTLWQFSTADGGINWHATVIDPQGAGAGDNLGNHIATKNLNMSTFDIFNIDKLLFASAGGFNFPVDRTLKGFSTSGTGIEANVPAFSEYRWSIDGIEQMRLESGIVNFNNNLLEDVGGIIFTPFDSIVHSITPLATHLEYNAGVGTVHQFKVNNGPAIIEINDNESAGGLKLFTDLNMQTQNINNIDVLRFVPDGGIIGFNSYGIAVDASDTGIKFGVPPTKNFSWQENTREIMRLTDNILQIANFSGLTFPNPTMQASEFQLITHSFDTSGLSDGGLRLVNDGFGNNDIIVGTGGNFVNLSKLTTFVGFTADDDLDMGTFNIFNLDVLRFVVDEGVIGFNVYGISADSTDTSMNFSVPPGRDYIFQNNLDPIAVIDETGFQVLPNLSVPDPIIVSREFLATEHSLGTVGISDGSWRLVSGDVIFGSGGNLVNLSQINPSFIGFTADDDLDMGTFNIFNLDVLRFVVDGGVIGNGQYGISADSTDTSLNFNVPVGRDYIFQNNLDPIAVIDESGIRVLSNTSFTNPIMLAREFTAETHSFGTSGLVDGSWRLVGGDVIFGSGGGLVNLTDLSAGAPGGGVTEGQNPVNWTGIHTHDGSIHRINSGFIFLGDSDTDQIEVLARFTSSLVPVTPDQHNLGLPGLEWRNLHLSGTAFLGLLDMGGSINMNGNDINNLPTTPVLDNDAVSKAYVDRLGDPQGSGFGCLSCNNTWTGENRFIVGDFFVGPTAGEFKVVTNFTQFAGASFALQNSSIALGLASSRIRIQARFDFPMAPPLGNPLEVDFGRSDARWNDSWFQGAMTTGSLQVNGTTLLRGDVTLGFFKERIITFYGGTGTAQQTISLSDGTQLGNTTTINDLLNYFKTMGLVG